MKVLVCGGRDFYGTILLFAVLDGIHQDTGIDTIIEGGATGADTLAKQWAEERGVALIEEKPKQADIDRFGYGFAAQTRNGRMADHRPDLVVAFPGGKGTKNMMMVARTRGIPLRIIGREMNDDHQ